MRAAVSVGNREASIRHGFWGESLIESVSSVASTVLSQWMGFSYDLLVLVVLVPTALFTVSVTVMMRESNRMEREEIEPS